MLVDNILSTVRTGIASSVARETDSGDSPAISAFKAAGYSGDLDSGAMEGAYDVTVLGGGDRDITGVPGRVDAFLKFRVSVRFVNESRSPAEALQYFAADMRRIADRVPQLVMDAAYGVTGAGVGACTLDGEWTCDVDSEEPSIYTGIANFLVEYHDVLVTT